MRRKSISMISAVYIKPYGLTIYVRQHKRLPRCEEYSSLANYWKERLEQCKQPTFLQS